MLYHLEDNRYQFDFHIANGLLWWSFGDKKNQVFSNNDGNPVRIQSDSHLEMLKIMMYAFRGML